MSSIFARRKCNIAQRIWQSAILPRTVGGKERPTLRLRTSGSSNEEHCNRQVVTISGGFPVRRALPEDMSPNDSNWNESLPCHAPFGRRVLWTGTCRESWRAVNKGYRGSKSPWQATLKSIQTSATPVRGGLSWATQDEGSKSGPFRTWRHFRWGRWSWCLRSVGPCSFNTRPSPHRLPRISMVRSSRKLTKGLCSRAEVQNLWG